MNSRVKPHFIYLSPPETLPLDGLLDTAAGLPQRSVVLRRQAKGPENKCAKFLFVRSNCLSKIQHASSVYFLVVQSNCRFKQPGGPGGHPGPPVCRYWAAQVPILGESICLVGPSQVSGENTVSENGGESGVLDREVSWCLVCSDIGLRYPVWAAIGVRFAPSGIKLRMLCRNRTVTYILIAGSM